MESFPLIQKMFCRLINISMRFVFLQLCVLLLIASCAVEGLGLVFFSRSLMPVSFLVSCFSLPLSWAHKVSLPCTSFIFSHHCRISGQLSCQKTLELANKNTKIYQTPHFSFLLMLIDVVACVRFLSDAKLDNFYCI